MTFWVNDHVKHWLLVAFAMYLSSVLVVGMKNLSADHRLTRQLLYIAMVLQHWNIVTIIIEFLHLSQGLLQMSSFHMQKHGCWKADHALCVVQQWLYKIQLRNLLQFTDNT